MSNRDKHWCISAGEQSLAGNSIGHMPDGTWLVLDIPETTSHFQVGRITYANSRKTALGMSTEHNAITAEAAAMLLSSATKVRYYAAADTTYPLWHWPERPIFDAAFGPENPGAAVVESFLSACVLGVVLPSLLAELLDRTRAGSDQLSDFKGDHA